VGKEPDLYKPAEACRIAEVAPYVLRYWETEFPVLSDGKEKGASRLYSTRDVKMISRIRELLYDEGFTVAGAKKRLESEVVEGRFDDGLAPAPPVEEQKKAKKAAPAAAEPEVAAKAAGFPERKQVVRELKEIAKILDRKKR
jgi:DNA-binding transcriptional MerR regulator